LIGTESDKNKAKLSADEPARWLTDFTVYVNFVEQVDVGFASWYAFLHLHASTTAHRLRTATIHFPTQLRLKKMINRFTDFCPDTEFLLRQLIHVNII